MCITTVSPCQRQLTRWRFWFPRAPHHLNLCLVQSQKSRPPPCVRLRRKFFICNAYKKRGRDSGRATDQVRPNKISPSQRQQPPSHAGPPATQVISIACIITCGSPGGGGYSTSGTDRADA